MQRTLTIAFLFCLAGAIPVVPETLPEARTDLVRLDAVVTDSHGALVRNLEQKDFAVFEDGKSQTITDFALGGRAPKRAAAPSTAATAAPGTAAAPEAAPVPAAGEEPSMMGRNVLIIIDDIHIAVSGLTDTKRALHRVIDEFVGSTDDVALISTSPQGPAQSFTRERKPLHAAIDTLTVQQRSSATMSAYHMTPAQAEMILAGDHQATELAGRNMLSEPGSVMDNAGPQAATQQGQAGIAGATRNLSDSKQQLAENEAKRQARAVLDEALVGSMMSLRAIDSALRSLGKLPGRKLCLLVSDGFLVGAGTSEERTGDMQRIVDAATRSGAVVYSLDSRGLMTSQADASTGAAGGMQQSPGLQSGVDRRSAQVLRTTLTTIAAQTGGFVVQGTNDFASGLNRMLEDNDAYYLLAYQPINIKRDGKFRKIEVKVLGHSDYLVRTRKGYLAPDDRKPKTETASAPAAVPLSGAEVRGLLDHLPASGVPVRLSADYVDLPPNGSQAIVRVQMPLSKMEWEKGAEGRRRAAVEWIGGVYDATGAPVGQPFTKRSDLELTAAEYDRAMKEGIRYQQTLALHPGKYQIRILARDAKGAALGGASEQIEIPDLGQKKLALSSVFLSSGAAGGDTLTDAQLLRRFKHGDTVYFQLYVYNPTLDEKGAADVVLQAQLRSGDKLVAASKPQPVTFEIKDGAPLPQTNGIPLETLPAGTYQLRIVVFDKKANVSVNRNIDLTIE
jgi:VWFA-related protein